MEKGWRKQMKRQARGNVKRHYAMLVLVCLIAGFLGSEFGKNSITVNNNDAVQEADGAVQEADGAVQEADGAAQSADDTAQGVDGTAVVTRVPGQSMVTEAFLEAIYGNSEKGREITQTLKEEEIEEAKKGSPVLGRSRGVLAMVVNSMTSGALLVTVGAALHSVFGSANAALVALIIGALALYLLFWFFVTNMYTVVSRRIFLEGRCYEKLPMQRFFFLLKVKRWTKVSVTMFVMSMYRMFWSFTIIGGFVKTFSYFLVPYIAAENPDIGAREAITLSRRMMKGHKWECFLLRLSFIGWWVLGSLTFYISRALYSNPYETAVFCEYYAKLRSLAIQNGIPGSEKLNDRYLFETAEESVLCNAYADVREMMRQNESGEKRQKGFAGFLARNFGVYFFHSEQERAYETWQDTQVKLERLSDAANGECYPGRLFPMPEEKKRLWVETAHYLRHYSIWHLIVLFFMFSFVGWVWEVSLHLISDGTFVNRGVLHGPWLPIYGTGSVLILVLLNRLRKNPAAEFLAAIVLCGIVEYSTAWYLEMTHGGQKWWDYSGYFLNLHGRICAEGLLVFGIGGAAIVYLAAPMLDNLLQRINTKILIPLALALLCIYGADQIYSGKHPNQGEGITDYSASLAISPPEFYNRG